MAKNNRKLIENRIEKDNAKYNVNSYLSSYDKRIDRISTKELDRVIKEIDFQSSGDYDVVIRGNIYVLTCDVVDSDNDNFEIDLSLLSQQEYICRYGDERWDEE